MKITKTRKIYISLFCIIVMTIVTGMVYFFHDEKEYIIGDCVSGVDDVTYIDLHNLYSAAANKTLGNGSDYYTPSFYEVTDKEAKSEFIKYLKKIEMVQPIENAKDLYNYGSYGSHSNRINMQVIIEPSENADCDKEKIYYDISLGDEKESGCVNNQIFADEGKKLVYVVTEHHYGYDRSYGKGAELQEQFIKENGDVIDVEAYLKRVSGEYLYVNATEALGEKWNWGYFCQMDEEDYNALFDLQYNTTKSVLNIDK